MVKSGIIIEACENSLQGHKIAKKDMFPGVVSVESGIGELVLLQQQGYAYFKP